MSPKLQSRSLSARYVTQRLPGGWWRLRATAPAWILYLREPRGADGADIGAVLAGGSTLAISWTGDAVRLDLGGSARSGTLHAAGALLHEPLDRLYDVLPLARYDSRERRFWGRVMTIVRLPGGAWLIERFARRRSAHGPP
ncbi:MAG TPA: hypothetical protein VMU86_06530 [Steroidobacteraceae bacterium]|nr:hypothetical protein [Steroidobacteraceae bacterium]